MKGLALEKIAAATSKSAQVYKQLKQALLQARFRPGEVLSIRTLAISLGTSTMPVREAVTRLISERALEPLPNRGVRIPVLTADQARDLFRVRLALEGLAVELAATRISARELRELAMLERQLEEALRARDLTRAVVTNIRFHFTLYQASGSETLVEMIESLYLRYAPMLYIVLEALPGGTPSQTLFVRDHHIAVLNAIRSGDAVGARRALENDLKAAIELDGFLGTRPSAQVAKATRPRSGGTALRSRRG